MSYPPRSRLYSKSPGSKEAVVAKIDGVQRATGRSRAEWFRVLDVWGAVGRPYQQISDWLTDEHGLSRWWAQKLIVEYEQERGVRPPGIRRDGTFEVGASKTVAVPVDRLFDAFVDSRKRKRWLADRSMRLKGSHAQRSARFDWEDRSSRVNVTFENRGRNKSIVYVIHDRLIDARVAQDTKAMWRDRLVDLKAYLESGR